MIAKKRSYEKRVLHASKNEKPDPPSRGDPACQPYWPGAYSSSGPAPGPFLPQRSFILFIRS
jgi:hypothetical protein